MTTDKRDLHADLAICNAATAGPWAARGWSTPTDDQFFVRQTEDGGKEVATAWQGVRYPDMPEISAKEASANARFIAEARTGWPHAIERALTAEELCAHQGRSILALAERNRELKVEVERLRGVLEYFAVSPIFRFVESPHSLRQMAQMALRKEATADDQC